MDNMVRNTLAGGSKLAPTQLQEMYYWNLTFL